MLCKSPTAAVYFVENPIWVADGFEDLDAQAFWLELALSLQCVALNEIASGNQPTMIQLDVGTGVVLIEFPQGPLSAIPPNADIRLHSHHATGNYCYDGTKCTLESRAKRSFLAFQDPQWVDDAL